MITAKEAREKNDTLKTLCGEKEKKKIEEMINRAIELGYDYCFLDDIISDAAEEWLKSLGYQVIKSYSGRDVQVRW